MSRIKNPNPWSALAEASAALTKPGQPETVFQAVDAALARVVGHKLITVLFADLDAKESQRLYTNMPAPYPVGGRKPIPASKWTERVSGKGQPFLGKTRADIRGTMPDAEKIIGLGLGSIINYVVQYDGTFLGTVNVLHEEGWYDERDVTLGAPIAGLVTSALLAHRLKAT